MQAVAKFRIEDFVDKFSEVFIPKLNERVLAMNVERPDGNQIEEIEANKWLLFTLNERAKNYRNFGLFHISSAESISNGPKVATTLTLEVDVFLYDLGNTPEVYRRVLRYWECMLEAATYSWDKACRGYDRPTISSLQPVDVKLAESNKPHKVFGIELEFTYV